MLLSVYPRYLDSEDRGIFETVICLAFSSADINLDHIGRAKPEGFAEPDYDVKAGVGLLFCKDTRGLEGIPDLDAGLLAQAKALRVVAVGLEVNFQVFGMEPHRCEHLPKAGRFGLAWQCQEVATICKMSERSIAGTEVGVTHSLHRM